MQSLFVVDLLYELTHVLFGFLEISVVLQADLLQLQRSEEALDLWAFS